MGPTTAMFWLRFAVGGAVVASVPIAAQRLGARGAALFMLIPYITILSLISIDTSNGPGATKNLAFESIPSLLPAAGFLAAYWLAIRSGIPFAASLCIGLAGWSIVALPVWLTR